MGQKKDPEPAGKFVSSKTANADLSDGMPRPDKTYEVGYAKPPADTQFKKGKSGNPRGRPRGSKNTKKKTIAEYHLEERLKQIVLDEAYRGIKINEGDKQVTVPIAQAVIRSVAHNAARGSIRAQRLFAEMVASTEAALIQKNTQMLEAAIEYKERWTFELASRKRLGKSGPDPLPHPDHVHIDLKSGEVKFSGPMTQEEKLEWDWYCSRKADCKEEIETLKQEITQCDDPKMKTFLQDDLKHSMRILEAICKIVPDPSPRAMMLEKFKKAQDDG